MKKILLIYLTPVVLCGCSIFNSQQVYYFKITEPLPVHGIANTQINVLPFTTAGLYDTKMVFIKDKNIVYFDQYNRWSEQPANLLTQYFSQCFASDNINSHLYNFNIEGQILRFEGNLDTRTALLVLHFNIYDRNTGKVVIRKTYTETTNLKKITASAFAEAISIATERVAEQLKQDIIDLTKK